MVNNFSRVMVFARFIGSTFPICLMILHTHILTIFFVGFLAWGFHSHFVGIKNMIGGHIGRSDVYSSSPLCFPIATTHPTCVFPSLVDDIHIIGPTLNVVLVFL